MYKIHSYNRYAIHAKIFIFCLCVLVIIGASILLGMEGNTPMISYQLNGSIVSQEVFEAFRSKLIVIEKTQMKDG
jgi:hypothetical protein